MGPGSAGQNLGQITVECQTGQAGAVAVVVRCGALGKAGQCARLVRNLIQQGVLVIEAGETPFDIAQKACQEFRDKSLLGVILNRVDPTYAYSSYYGSYYKPRLEGETLITKTRKT